MGQVANRGDFHHPCAALEGVQITQQVFHLNRVLRLVLPAGQGAAGAFDNVEAFLKEDLQQFRVALFEDIDR